MGENNMKHRNRIPAWKVILPSFTLALFVCAMASVSERVGSNPTGILATGRTTTAT